MELFWLSSSEEDYPTNTGLERFSSCAGHGPMTLEEVDNLVGSTPFLDSLQRGVPLGTQTQRPDLVDIGE